MQGNNSLEYVSKDLIKLAGEAYQNIGILKPEILHSLYLIHGQTLHSALDLIDNEKVSIIESPSGRWIFKVIGSSGSFYTLLPESIYCQCAAFKFSVLCKKDSLICKHVLAAKLVFAMKIAKKKQASDDDMVDILMNI